MKNRAFLGTAATLALAANLLIQAFPVSAADFEFRTGSDGKLYWYENNVKQGTLDDKQGILGDGTNRGREIYDPATNGWYWLDSVYDGAKAEGKEVWIPYVYQDELIMSEDGYGRIANGIADEAKISELAALSITDEAGMSAQVADAIRSGCGKWVRYDEKGCMLKGWVRIEGALAECYPTQIGNIYYYDQKTGLMAKGNVTINGVEYHFNEITGVLDSGEKPKQEYVRTSAKTYINDVLDSETFYDKRGNEIKVVNYTEDGSSYVDSEYQYDENGNRIYMKYIWFMLSDDDISYNDCYYEYDDDGHMTKSTIYNDGELFYTTYYETDEKGNVTKEEYYDESGKLVYTVTTVYEYTDLGYKYVEEINYNNIVQTHIEGDYLLFNGKYLRTRYLVDDSETYRCDNNTYDEEGNMVHSVSYNRDGSVRSTQDSEYEYDSDGNLVKVTTTAKDPSGTVTSVSVTVYEYKSVIE